MNRRSCRDIAEFAEKKLGVRIFSNEYQIVFLLHDCDSLSVGQIASETKVSPATFQNKLKNLVLLGLIAWESDHSDSRRHKYRLSEYARGVLNQELQFLTTWRPSFPEGSKRMNVIQFVRSIETKLKVKLFSLEYQLILGMYDHGPMHTIALQKWSGMSPRSFHNTLNRLVIRGLVTKQADNNDLRRKFNCLENWVTATLDEVHRDLSTWSAKLPVE